jgi:hypothetical protein
MENNKFDPRSKDHISRAPFMQPILDKMHEQQVAWKEGVEKRKENKQDG